MRRNLNARQPAKNISASPPSRKVMGPSGVMVTEKLAPLWGVKMVAPDGDVATVTFSTGFTIRGLKGSNEHGVQKHEDKLKAGFVPFAECPLILKRIPKLPGEQPCDGEFSDSKCCPHIERLIAERRAAHRTGQLEYGKNFESQTDRLLAHIQKQAQDSVAERPAASPSGKGGRIGG